MPFRSIAPDTHRPARSAVKGVGDASPSPTTQSVRDRAKAVAMTGIDTHSLEANIGHRSARCRKL